MAVGADTHWGAGPPAHGCGALTAALYAVAAGLRQRPSETVVRESTGVSGMALVAVRAARGCDVKLVAPHAVRQVPGRKTDGQEGQGLPERPPDGVRRGALRPEDAVGGVRRSRRQRRRRVARAARRAPHAASPRADASQAD